MSTELTSPSSAHTIKIRSTNAQIQNVDSHKDCVIEGIQKPAREGQTLRIEHAVNIEGGIGGKSFALRRTHRSHNACE